MTDKATGTMPDQQRSVVDQAVLDNVIQMVNDARSIVPPFMEVVVHDFAKLPNSIVAVAGSVTGRGVGSPATNVLLRDYARDELGRYALAYKSTLADGRTLNCSSILITSEGRSIGALCINLDTSVFTAATDALSGIFATIDTTVHDRRDNSIDLAPPIPGDIRGKDNTEVYPRTIDDLVTRLIDESITAVDVPVELMRKEHKKAVVRDLQDRGMFVVKNSVEAVAAALQVTRFTVYNYLNEIDGEDAGTV